MDTVYIIGSGPSGVACALGLLARGDTQVVMLDVGKQLEPEILERRLAAKSPITFPDTHSKQFSKHIFGSLYPYIVEHFMEQVSLKNAVASASHAQGGLSNIWGASVMPYRQDDMRDWPISADELQLYYKKVLDYLPLSTCHQNDLQDWPLFHDQPQAYLLNPQAQHLWKKYLRNKDQLNKVGIKAGGARLALFQNRCTSCGECMHGCIQDAVYSTRHTLALLRKNPLFHYQGGMRVEKISESGHGVTLDVTDVNNQAPLSFTGKKVFLGTGVILSAQLLMQSFASIGSKEIKIQDSQHFMLPCLISQRGKDSKQQRAHALSQLFYEVQNPAIHEDNLHLQLYTYTDLFQHELKNKLGRLGRFSRALTPALERLTVMQGYLPSNASGEMKITYSSDSKKLVIQGYNKTDAQPILKRLNRFLVQNAFQLGLLPLSFLSKLSQIGSGNHFGGSFPMKNQPHVENESDTLGRPFGLRHTHLIDASILPTIASQSITLTTMANAYRIGSLCSLGLEN